MTLTSPFGKRLKQAREKAGLSQKKLGILAGIEESNASAIMNQYERGTHQPKFPLARKIADVLKVPTAFFYTDDDNLAELLELFGQLNPPNQRAVLDDIRCLKQDSGYETSYTNTQPHQVHE
ncbi:MAG: helix-turn-helix domain-containing protein [Gammaproteobacteria bacterium]|nr:helix-turn-helix domain-containing protein [Gammaproteobacteria bacterium]